MKGAQGYVALVLDEETKAKLLSLVILPEVYCTHVTMAYRPKPEVYAKYQPLLGKDFDFEITGIRYDGIGQCARVTGVPTENEVAHITMSCDRGVKPSHSKELMQDPKVREVFANLKGRGTVQWKHF